MTDTCRNGHPRTDENTLVTPTGSPRCRTCRRATERANRDVKNAWRASNRDKCSASAKRWLIASNDLIPAHNSKKEWTGPELEVATRPDLTLREAARLLGRTVSAVTVQRGLAKGRDRRKAEFGTWAS